MVVCLKYKKYTEILYIFLYEIVPISVFDL